ncbi:AEC family transporter [Acinetobacter indicus]|uniref:AEC family transporter n=1 Tax=Acinetobacter indicus TaxID=756892 RepID=UPI001443FEE8|nr:AEC family transporter [Acinetobacter indicus]
MLLNILLPLVAVLALGYSSVRTNFLAATHIQALSQFVMKVSLPAFLLYALASKDLAEIWHPGYFIGYGLGSLILFFLALVIYKTYFRHSLTHASVLSMGASMSNTGFIGTAILTLLIGSHSAIYLSLTLIIENLIIVAMVLFLAEAGSQKQNHHLSALYLKTLKSLLKNPVILSIIAGMACVLLNLKLPDSINQILEMLGKTASPLALFVIGGSLVGMRLHSVNLQSVLLVGMKVLLMPLVIFTLLWSLPNVSSEMLFVGTLLAALPMPVAFGIFGQNYGLNEQALQPLIMSTVLGLIGVAFWLSQSSHFL